jgi:hypothetical protein
MFFAYLEYQIINYLDSTHLEDTNSGIVYDCFLNHTSVSTRTIYVDHKIIHKGQSKRIKETTMNILDIDIDDIDSELLDFITSDSSQEHNIQMNQIAHSC